MKRTLLFIFLSLFLLDGCSSRRVNETLKDVESYIMERPDSALTVLDTMDRALLATDRLKAHHALLHAMALDKNFVDVTDDSLASIAVEYYSKKGPDKYYARSLYYLGLSYYYAQDYKEAILEFTKAEKLARGSDSLYLGMIKCFQGHTYGKTHNDIEQLDCYKASYEIFKNLDNRKLSDAAMLDLSHVLFNIGRIGESKEILEQMISNETIDLNIIQSVIISYAFVNVVSDKQADYFLADQMYSRLIAEYGSSQMTYKNYWAWAYSLSKLGRNIEAQEMVSQLIEIDTSGTADYWMYMIKKSAGNTKEALSYLEKSTTKINKEVTKALQQSLALSQRDYYESEFENAEYKARNRKLIAISVGIGSILILVLVLWGTSVYVKRQREEKEYYLNYADEIRRQLEASKNDDYPELKRKYLEISKSRFEMIASLYEEYVLYQGKKNAEHAVYSKVSEIINAFLTDNANHKQLESVLDESLGGIVSMLRKEMPKLKEIDYSIFCYAIIGFDATTISHLLNISTNVVYIRKSRMRQHIEETNPDHKNRFLEVLR